jgi:hypothetical protein
MTSRVRCAGSGAENPAASIAGLSPLNGTLFFGDLKDVMPLSHACSICVATSCREHRQVGTVEQGTELFADQIQQIALSQVLPEKRMQVARSAPGFFAHRHG